MSDPPAPSAALPAEQHAIRARARHPSGAFVAFSKADTEQSIPARFAQMVARHGDRVAVRTPGETLTYEALNRRANRIAHAVLRERGSIQEPIALLLPTGAAMIAALLGILKAGKLFVPLGPSWPGARIEAVLADSQAPLMLTDGASLATGAAHAPANCRVLDLDALDPELPASDPALPIAPGDLTYIVYTSGSTGQPKGVTQNHRNGLHEAMLYANGLRICAEDRLALLYPCHASQGLKITLAALLNGAALCPFDLARQGLDQLTPWLAGHEITVYFSVPAVFRQWVAGLGGVAELPALRLIQLGSDSVTRADLDLYRAHWRATPTILMVRLGSTETGTLCTCFFDGAYPEVDDLVPVGYPVDDVEITLRDDDGGVVSPGGHGEIVVRSRYLSPGYWRQPELTRARFVPDPTEPGCVTYPTGDLGRMRADGGLLHLGRTDQQVKIRGNRVELAEIESALLALPTVKEAVVTARADHTGATGLVAHVVPERGGPLSIGELRRALAGRVPDYMLPSAYVRLDALPLTAGGKVDRRALADPGRQRPELDVAFQAPRTVTEEALVSIWADVLGLDRVGVHDPFLDLGGHSLAATRVLSRVIERFQVALPLGLLLETPTVADLAEVLTRHSPDPSRDLTERG